MELEEKRLRTVTQPLPVMDQTASVPLVSNGRPGWKSRLAFTWPLIYGIHIIVFISLGIVFAVLASIRGGVKKHKTALSEVLPELLAAGFGIISTLLLQFVFLPRFWRNRAREMVTSGMFDYTATRSNVYGHRIVLEIGCSEGIASACFAREIFARQGDIASALPSASLPLFIGHDKWSKWTRIPNNPRCYLETLTGVGVPRDLIRTSRVDETDTTTRTTLPFADNSISLIISYLGLEEIAKWKIEKERRMLFRELVRVLAVGGAMIMFENRKAGVDKDAKKELKTRGWFEGPMVSYQRILVHEFGWEEDWVQVRWSWGIHYLIARKEASV